MFVATWLLFSGHYTPLLLMFGALSCTLVLVLARRIGFFEVEAYAFHLAPRLPGYWLWLLKEVFTANVTIAKIVLNPRLPISPTIVSVDASALSPLGQTILANSITLTPGTVSTDLSRGRIEVHCLTQEGAAELKEGGMLRKVAGLEEG